MSIDRYLIFIIENWKKIYFTQGVAVVTCLDIGTFIFAINSNVLFIYGYQFEINGTIITQGLQQFHQLSGWIFSLL